MPLDPKTAALRAARLARDAARPRVEPADQHYRVFGLLDEIPFGKHRGHTIEFLIDAEIGYVTWLLENTSLELSDDAEREYHSRLGPRHLHGVG